VDAKHRKNLEWPQPGFAFPLSGKIPPGPNVKWIQTFLRWIQTGSCAGYKRSMWYFTIGPGDIQLNIVLIIITALITELFSLIFMVYVRDDGAFPLV
jgi:hypothetical protein